MTDVDVPAVVVLSKQLRYDPTADQVAERFALLQSQETVGFYVAQTGESDGIAGWIHVYGVHTLVSTPYAEVASIVVHEADRLSGVGRALMQSAERWAVDHSYGEVRLRSGHHRHGAHRFYRQLGYEIARESHTFRRFL